MSTNSRRRVRHKPCQVSPDERRSSAVSADLVPRTIYFPRKWLARVEAQGPGALIALLTVALSAHQSKGGM